MEQLNRKMRRMDKSKKVTKLYKELKLVAQNENALRSSFSGAVEFEMGARSNFIKGLSKQAANQSHKKK